MRRKKLSIAFLSLAVCVVTLLTQGTIAYYTTVGTATNVITSGDIRMSIIEKMGEGAFPAKAELDGKLLVIDPLVQVDDISGNSGHITVTLNDELVFDNRAK